MRHAGASNRMADMGREHMRHHIPCKVWLKLAPCSLGLCRAVKGSECLITMIKVVVVT